MDFSTPERSVLSLSRRRPPLPDQVLEAADELHSLMNKTSTRTGTSTSTSTEGKHTNKEEAEAMEEAEEAYGRAIASLIRYGGGGEEEEEEEEEEGDKDNNKNKDGRRWEPLAVGIYLAADYLSRQTAAVLEKASAAAAAAAAAASTAATPDDGHESDKESRGNSGAAAAGTERMRTVSLGGGEYYAEGPRVPAIRNLAAPFTAPVPAAAEELLHHDEVLDAVSPPSPRVAAADSAASAVVVMARPTTVSSFCGDLMERTASPSMEHPEPRVRTLIAKVVGAHARYGLALDVWIRATRDEMATMAAAAAAAEVVVPEVHNELLNEAETASACLSAQRRRMHRDIVTGLRRQMELGRDASRANSKDSTGALDDTTGWRAVETHLHALAAYIDGCGGYYVTESEREDGVEDDGHVGENGNGGVDDPTLLDSIEQCSVHHVNRHVRAAGIAVLDRMVSSVSSAGKTMHYLGDNAGGQHGSTTTTAAAAAANNLRKVVVSVLKTTLEDNWSQVRMAASVLCRTFLLALLRAEEVEEKGESRGRDMLEGLYPILLPRMCLNRFYLAQGVKLYSHDTWRMVFPPPPPGSETTTATRITHRNGLEKVSQYAGPICRYYCRMCDADNHVVREAACQAVAELARKIGEGGGSGSYVGVDVGGVGVGGNGGSTTVPDMIRRRASLAPYVPSLLQSLVLCFHDESWPVRDEAALACGTFCRAYPEECRPELDALFGRWTDQLTDQIWSVREDAGVALGDAVVAYGTEMYERVLMLLREAIPSAKSQPAMTLEEYKRRQNDMDAHTNNQLYSCGSLAPKLKKGSAVDAEALGGAYNNGSGQTSAPGKGRIGCTSCFVDRPRSPWERTDGSIYLLRELCDKCIGPSGEASARHGIDLDDGTLLPLVSDLVDSCRLKHYPQSDDLRATLWRQLPPIARSLGRNRFKRVYLDLFLDLLMSNLDDRYGGSGASALSIHAAGQCAEELSDLVGRGIFRGRLEEEWQRRAFDRVVEERARTAGSGPSPAGRMEPDVFSPFGPPLGVGAVMAQGPTSSPSSMGGRGREAGVGGARMEFSSPPIVRAAVPGTGTMDSL